MRESVVSVAARDGEEESSRAPFFSIGVTTYNRPELLKQALRSVMRQTFLDFEVIVGNDYIHEPVSVERLGIDDLRIRFVNHPRNLGEVANMNALLGMARGRYFTWLADDDLYAAEFLAAVYAALMRFGSPPCVFTSYVMASTDSVGKGDSLSGEPRLMSGRQFLREYLARSLKTLGCYGVFDIQHLKRFGGLERLGDGFSPYSDNLLTIRCGALERVAYIGAPLIVFRAHEGSISLTSPDVDAYSTAQQELCRKSVVILRGDELREDFLANLSMLLRWCISDFAVVVGRAGWISPRQAIGYLVFLIRYINLLKGSALYWRALSFLMKTIVALVSRIGRARLRRWIKPEVSRG